MSTRQPLDAIQKWMQAVITHPEGVAAGIASKENRNTLEGSENILDRIILPSTTMSSLDRLQIYGRAYFGRLIECLRTQFPSVRQATGDDAFDGLAYGYLVHHPSTDYTLGSLGDSFAAFLNATRPENVEARDFADFLIDLARLERAYAEVFDCQGPESSLSLQPSDLEHLSAEDFAKCRLIPHSCVRILEFRFPVHEYATAVRHGTPPSPPVSRAVYLVVTRRDYVVRRFEITQIQFDLLSSIQEQSTIGESLLRLGSRTDINFDSLKLDIQKWFSEWTAFPLFSKLGRPAD